MTNLNAKVYDSIIKVINQFKPSEDIVVSRANLIAEQPDYPYITVDLYDDPQPITRSHIYTQLTVPVQIKAISDDEDQAKDLGLFLRRLFYYEVPLEQLDQQGIVPTKCSSIPNVPAYAENLIQFTSGADITFIVIDDNIVDISRPTTLERAQGIVGTNGNAQEGIDSEKKG